MQLNERRHRVVALAPVPSADGHDVKRHIVVLVTSGHDSSVTLRCPTQSDDGDVHLVLTSVAGSGATSLELVPSSGAGTRPLLLDHPATRQRLQQSMDRCASVDELVADLDGILRDTTGATDQEQQQQQQQQQYQAPVAFFQTVLAHLEDHVGWQHVVDVDETFRRIELAFTYVCSTQTRQQLTLVRRW